MIAIFILLILFLAAFVSAGVYLYFYSRPGATFSSAFVLTLVAGVFGCAGFMGALIGFNYLAASMTPNNDAGGEYWLYALVASFITGLVAAIMASGMTERWLARRSGKDFQNPF